MSHPRFPPPYPDRAAARTSQESSGGGPRTPPGGTAPLAGRPLPSDTPAPSQKSGSRAAPIADNAAPQGPRPHLDEVGAFTYITDTATLTWDEGMYTIHGYEPGDIVPTLEVGFAHVEPACRERARALGDEALTAGGVIAWYYTLIDARTRPRRVLAIIDPLIEEGVVRGMQGFLVDVTGSVRDDTANAANTAVARSAEKRAVIEQAKGVLLVTHGLGADEAFARLNRYSQRVNRKVSLLAQDILDATADPQILRTLTRSICAGPESNQ